MFQYEVEKVMWPLRNEWDYCNLNFCRQHSSSSDAQREIRNSWYMYTFLAESKINPTHKITLNKCSWPKLLTQATTTQKCILLILFIFDG